MQTIKMTNRQAYDMLTLIERTIAMIKMQDHADTQYFEEIRSIENAIHESCPELVDRWRLLKETIKTAAAGGDETHKVFRQAVDEFDEWINLNE